MYMYIFFSQFLLPKKKFQCLEFVDSYQTPDVCNFIGLDLYAAAPVPSADIIRLDIVPYQEKGKEFFFFFFFRPNHITDISINFFCRCSRFNRRKIKLR